MRKLACLALAMAACSSSPGMNPDTGSKTFALAPFTLQPGQEQINCYYFPSDHMEHFVSKITADMNPGSHHLVVFRIDETQTNGVLPPAGPTECAQTDIPAGLDGMLPGSQQLHAEFAMPAGVGMKVEKYHGLYFQSHYINATQSTITTDVKYTLGFTDAASVKQEAGVLFYSNFKLNIPPGMSSASQTCMAPQDMSLLMATGHMHMHGLTFDATVAQKNIYHTNNWDEPNGSLFPSPGYSVKFGDPISWTCAYDNTTTSTLTFGNSASKNEMCILAGIFYPADSGQTLFYCQ
jgi:hypothetical protein